MVFNKELSAARQAGAGLASRKGGELGGGVVERQRLRWWGDALAFSGHLGSVMRKG